MTLARPRSGHRGQVFMITGIGVHDRTDWPFTITGMRSTLAEPVSPHGLRAGFVTTAYRNGVPDEEIMGHTRHRSLTTMRSYVRRAKLSQASPAGKLGL